MDTPKEGKTVDEGTRNFLLAVRAECLKYNDCGNCRLGSFCGDDALELACPIDFVIPAAERDLARVNWGIPK